VQRRSKAGQKWPVFAFSGLFQCFGVHRGSLTSSGFVGLLIGLSPEDN
jgi:hypothetical protein